jgi:predicted ribosome-associated RNA-binding protein Tma20
MYWFNSKKILAVVVCGLYFILILPACKPAIQQNASLKYFDVKGFFSRDSARLTKLNSLIFKTVYHNGATESKKVHIDNWGTELGLFSGSDINRPAWVNSYKIINEGNIIIYKAKSPELATQEILIKQINGKVEYMLIYNHSKNLLYTNDEELTYFPDSLYQINKVQSVRLLGTNKYQIKGFFNQR